SGHGHAGYGGVRERDRSCRRVATCRRRDHLDVLAFRRRSLGGRVHRRLRHRALRRKMTKIEVPAPTAWPIVLASGCTLLFAGLVTSASVSELGGMLVAAGRGGWIQGVFAGSRG